MAAENSRPSIAPTEGGRIAPPGGASLDTAVAVPGLPIGATKDTLRLVPTAAPATESVLKAADILPLLTTSPVDVFPSVEVHAGDDASDPREDGDKDRPDPRDPDRVESRGNVPPHLPPPDGGKLTGGAADDEFGKIMKELGLHSDIEITEDGDRRINTRTTQETFHAIYQVVTSEDVSMTEAARKLLGIGLLTDNLHEAKIPVTKTDVVTGEETPFPTETTLENVTVDTEIPVLDEDHPFYGFKRVDIGVSDKMLEAITTFRDRHGCTDEEAFNALSRRGVLTRDALTNPRYELSFRKQSRWPWRRKPVVINYIKKDE